MTATTETAAPNRRTWLYLLPVLVFVVIGGFLAFGLTRDPTVLPSALLDRPAPQFELPPIPGRDDHGFSRADLGGEPMLVNVWASWCVPCRAEHPLITRLAEEEGVTVNALNYKDAAEDAKAWLAKLGDPFKYIGWDNKGRAAIEWGVYGVPETFVVDRNGTIVYKQVGQVTPRVINEVILPLIRKLREQ